MLDLRGSGDTCSGGLHHSSGQSAQIQQTCTAAAPGSEQSPGSPIEATAHAATASQLTGATGATTRGGTATAALVAAAILYLLQIGAIGPVSRSRALSKLRQSVTSTGSA